jgi:hypothetical protein
MPNVDLAKIQALLAQCSRDERRELLSLLRKEFPIHDLERKLNTTAEVILEAIDRSSDLTLRGVRGVIAEAAFKEYVVLPLVERGWADLPVTGNSAFDFLLQTPNGFQAKVQVKMQRQKSQRPMRALDANRRMFANVAEMWVVETQKTRGGKDAEGQNTRPYRFGEFDILAVSMHPSTNDWSTFSYTVAHWLIPDPGDQTQVFKFQPVATEANDDWTNDLEKCVGWLRSGHGKTIQTSPQS